MDLKEKYFADNTRGFKILNRFYSKYRDLFIKSVFTEFEDFRNQIFLNISGIKFPDNINNQEAYIIGAIKIQCRVQLNKALKYKDEKPESQSQNNAEIVNEDGISISEQTTNFLPDPHQMPEGEEIFNIINIFKLQLNTGEKVLLNNMTDGNTGVEIGEGNNLNMGTLDNIRRLRIKFFAFLKEYDLNYEMFKKYEKSE